MLALGATNAVGPAPALYDSEGERPDRVDHGRRRGDSDALVGAEDAPSRLRAPNGGLASARRPRGRRGARVRDRLARTRPLVRASRGNRDGRADPFRRYRRRRARCARRDPGLRDRDRHERRPPPGDAGGPRGHLPRAHGFRRSGDRGQRRARGRRVARARGARRQRRLRAHRRDQVPGGGPGRRSSPSTRSTRTPSPSTPRRWPMRSAASPTTTPPASTTSATRCSSCARTASA